MCMLLLGPHHPCKKLARATHACTLALGAEGKGDLVSGNRHSGEEHPLQ